MAGLLVEKDGENLKTIITRIEKGQYQPNIDTIFEFGELVGAHERMDRNEFAGKVVAF